MVTKKDIKKIKTPQKIALKPERYFEAIGGRKTAHARVRLYTKNTDVIVNGKNYKEYFKIPKHQSIVVAPFETMKLVGKMGVTAKVMGGGLNAQAEAIRNGLARTLVLFNADFKKRLRNVDFLTRDPRMVERKKYGLKKARRAPQWAKR